MNYKLHIRVALTLLLALVVQACNLGIPQPPDQQTLEPTPVQTTQPQNIVLEPCSNPLYPVKTGATWTYRSTGSLSGDFSFTDTIMAVREDGFTLSSEIDGATLDQEWVCKPEGLASLSFGSGAAGGLSASGVQMDLTTSNIQGVIVPKTVNAGDQWPYSLDLDGNMQYSGTSVDTRGTASFTFNALGEESVTVPAGTFNAMKIHVDLKLDLQVTYSGFTAPATFTIPSDIWYAPGVGWVKATSSGDIFGMAFNETIELQSYSIP
jgi:hypothetical protein